MVPHNCSVSHILQNIFLCVQQNKDIHTGLELLEDVGLFLELQNFHFWVNYPFNIYRKILLISTSNKSASVIVVSLSYYYSFH